MAVLTEQEYRRLSGDTTTPWASSGNTQGAQAWVAVAVGRIEDHLHTYLEPTETEAEKHRVFPDPVYAFPYGAVGVWREVMLDKFRLLEGGSYDISVTVTHHNYCACTSTTSTACATVLDAKLSIVNISPCLSSINSQCCWWVNTVPHYIAVDYFAGFAAVPDVVKECVAVLAREYIKGLPCGGNPITERPTGAPLTSLSHLGVARTWAAPHTDTVFGRTHLGLELTSRLQNYRVIRPASL